MTRYQIQVDVPASTAQSSAVTDTIEVEERVITEGFRYAAPGSAETVRAELRFGDRPLLPSPESSRTVLPGSDLPAPINVEVPGVPTEVELRAWAPNADFQHTVTAQFDAVSKANAPQEVTIVSQGEPRAAERREPTAADLRAEDTDG